MKHWMTTATKGGKSIRLYVTTSERSIGADLAAGPAGSLILGARSHPGYSGTSPDTDDRDLAVGAFSYHMSRHGLAQTRSISEASKIPSDLKSYDFGGDPAYAIRLYEEPVA
jgi:hypothetical protein